MSRLRTALVTGATGFVGGHLARHLRAQGWRVRALSRRPADGPWDDHVSVDIGRDELPADALAGVDTVFHAAGKAHAVAELDEGDSAFRAVNVRGTRLLLDAARAHEVARFVLFSSVKADPADTPYGRSKRAAEELVLHAARRTALHAAVLRPALVYGPGMKGNLERMLVAVERNRFPPIADNGNRRSMVHVADLARAACLVADRPVARGRVYVVTDGQAYSTREIHLAMATALDRPVPRWAIPVPVLTAAARAGDVAGRLRGRRVPFDSTALSRLVDSARYDSADIERELGFRAQVDLLDALPEIVRCHRARAG